MHPDYEAGTAFAIPPTVSIYVHVWYVNDLQCILKIDNQQYMVMSLHCQ